MEIKMLFSSSFFILLTRSIPILGHGHISEQWKFPEVRLTDWDGREAKYGDCCCYTSWLKHADPIIKMMKYYNRVKNDFKKEHEMRDKSIYPTQDPYQFVTDVARTLSEARVNATAILDKQITANNYTHPILFPPDCCMENDQGEYEERRPRSIVRMLCEGGELMKCKQSGGSEEGQCQCFDVEGAQPMYRMKTEHGHCRAVNRATCNGEDPVISAKCSKSSHCVNFTVKACKLAFGESFHCDGVYDPDSKKLNVGKQNLFCAQNTNQPEDFNDFALNLSYNWALVFISFVLSS